MPDQLESALRAQRDRLAFDQPPLAVITGRAGVLRRRRRSVQVGLAAVLALGLPAAFVLRDDKAPAPAPAASTRPAVVHSGGGITLSGLPRQPLDLPGEVKDVAFVDADRAFLLTVDCPQPSTCRAYISGSVDGGRTFATGPAPGVFGAPSLGALPQLVVTGSGVTLLSTSVQGQVARASSEDGLTWETSTQRLGEPAALAGDARMTLFGAQVAAVQRASISKLVTPIAVSWVSPVRAGDGAWWVGGSLNGRPAVAVSRDAGVSWTPTTFEGPGQARVAFLGRDVHVTVVDPATAPQQLLGVASSRDGGVTFDQFRPAMTTIGGDLIPLLDGRLLIVDGQGHWLASPDRGATWTRLQGLHPTALLTRTQTGWVAHRMSTIYTAYSVDGTTWQKLDAT